MSDDLQPIIIDFNECSNDTLNESFLKMFGFAVKSILKYMFNDSPIPVKIKGHPTQVKSFVNALAQEKRYLDLTIGKLENELKTRSMRPHKVTS